MKKIMRTLLNQKQLSPYIGGVLIGLLQIPTLFFVGKLLGLSSSYGAFSARFLDLFVNISELPYIKKSLEILGNFHAALALGIVMGAYLSSKLLKSRKKGISSYWKAEGLSSRHVYIRSFIGGIFLVFGARLAGGCTSGHGISGISTFSKGSFLTISVMFLSAIASFNIIKSIVKRND
jgi:uncharacterized membrane protein YedE/YeeE